MGKRIYIILGILAVLVLFLVGPSFTGNDVLVSGEEVDFYKSASCGCCGLHSKYLSGKGGLDINVIQMPSVDGIKDDFGIPSALRSCHTAVIEGYFVEGHMPLEAINKLMEEKPDIAGIALPGMPSGSPGMPGVKNKEWIIYAVNHDGSSSEFMRI